MNVWPAGGVWQGRGLELWQQDCKDNHHKQVDRRKLRGCVYLFKFFLPSSEYELLANYDSFFQAVPGFKLLSVLSWVLACLFGLNSRLHACYSYAVLNSITNRAYNSLQSLKAYTRFPVNAL